MAWNALRRSCYNGLNRSLHTSIACLSPRKRPGNRKPMPEEEIRKRVEEIVYGGRKKPEPPDYIDYDFKKVGKYRVKDKKIQELYREYLRLYHPELAGDIPDQKGDGDNRHNSNQKASVFSLRALNSFCGGCIAYLVRYGWMQGTHGPSSGQAIPSPQQHLVGTLQIRRGLMDPRLGRHNSNQKDQGGGDGDNRHNSNQKDQGGGDGDNRHNSNQKDQGGGDGDNRHNSNQKDQGGGDGDNRHNSNQKDQGGGDVR